MIMRKWGRSSLYFFRKVHKIVIFSKEKERKKYMNKCQHVLSVFTWCHVGHIVQNNEMGVMSVYQKIRVDWTWGLNSSIIQKRFFWFEKLHSHWPREWKRSIVRPPSQTRFQIGKRTCHVLWVKTVPWEHKSRMWSGRVPWNRGKS